MLGGVHARYTTCYVGSLSGYGQEQRGISTKPSKLYIWYNYIATSHGIYNMYYDLTVDVLMRCICKIYT